jgi:hypothetical protein
MTVSIRALSVTNPQELESLVAAALESFEPGLTLLDRRFVAGATVVDLLAIDAHSRLALWFLSVQADGLMLLRAMEAYGWCRENGSLLLRLFPARRIDVAAVPRLSLLAPRFPDHFRTTVRYLTSLNLTCVEYRYLDVNGSPTLFFEPVEGLTESRPAPAGSEPMSNPVGAPPTVAPVEPPPPRPASPEPEEFVRNLERLRFREAFKVDRR